MRVLLVVGMSTGGVGRHVHGLIEGMSARGHDVVVAAPAEVEAQFRFEAAGARHVPLAVADRPSPVGDARALTVLGRLAGGADVVHAHGLRAGALACLSARRSGAPVAVTLHNAAPGGSLNARVYGLLERVVARRAAAVLGVSADLVARQQALGAPVVGLAVIPAPPPPAVRPDGRAVREALGVPEGRFLVLAIARLAPQKGLHLLLDAVALLTTPPVVPLEVVVAGDGPEREALEERIGAEHLPVRLLGHRRDVPQLCAAADAVVSSAVWEGQPINLQEALHAGAAIVATDVGGSAAVLGDAAILTPVGDAAALAAALRRVAEEPGLRERLRARAKARSAELPTQQDAVEAVEGLYTRLSPRASRRDSR
jgi:glycosyltransferase involved in cell wall biosynthesis